MKQATQKELERIRDEAAEKYSFLITGNKNKSKEDWNIEAAFNSGFDKGAEEMAKIKDTQIEKLVEALIAGEKYLTSTGADKIEECEPEYQMLMSFREALENFRKEVK